MHSPAATPDASACLSGCIFLCAISAAGAAVAGEAVCSAADFLPRLSLTTTAVPLFLFSLYVVSSSRTPDS